MGRSIIPDGDKIKTLREARGWQIEDLAGRTGCSVRTVQNLERGNGCFKCTLVAFAEVLGVDYGALVIEHDPLNIELELENPPHTEILITFKITLNKRRNELDESDELLDFLRTLQRFLGQRRIFDVKAIQEGSVILTVEMLGTDVVNLMSILARSNPRFTKDGPAIKALQFPPGVLVPFQRRNSELAWVNNVEIDNVFTTVPLALPKL